MIRTGEKGKSEFKEASWEEALDHIAEGFNKVKDNHGPEALVSQKV